MSKKLNIITAGTEEKNKLTIINNEDNYNLAYLTDDNTQVNITNESSRYRPIRMSELKKLLESRDWNITERKYVRVSGGNVYLKLKVGISSSGPVDIIDSTLDRQNDVVVGITVCNEGYLSSASKEQFNNEYKTGC